MKRIDPQPATRGGTKRPLRAVKTPWQLLRLLRKFDGVTGNKDKELEDPKGYGAIEYAYHLMARAAGIAMSECRLLEQHGRRHCMTRRFDRLTGGEQLHMQSLGALGLFDFNQPGAYVYEQALMTTRRLYLPMAAVEEQFRRMVFNIIACNQESLATKTTTSRTSPS